MLRPFVLTLLGVASIVSFATAAPPKVTSLFPGGAQRGTEVVVTAQRRAQRLQDVPLSVTAATAQTLANANVTSSEDLAQVTPGLRMDAGGVFIDPVIRGISTYETAPNADVNIATYVDGVYIPSPTGDIFSFNNINKYITRIIISS